MIELIAEIGASHNGSLITMETLIRTARDSGFNAVKIQTWKKDLMASKHLIMSGPWAGKTTTDLYDAAHTPWEWYDQIFLYAKSLDIELFSSVFDKESVDFLEQYNCSRYKISSFDIVDLDLISYASKTGKPIIISTGMASFNEINQAIHVASQSGCQDLTILKCTSTYPAPERDCNLVMINEIREKFGVKTGLSDHTKRALSGIISVGLGAAMIEKHIKLDDKSLDSGFAISGYNIMSFVDSIRAAENMLGRIHYGPLESEQASFALRKSIHSKHKIPKGANITNDDICLMRPNSGIHPHKIASICGKKALVDIGPNEPILFDEID